MYVIVTTNKEIAEEAKCFGAKVLEIPEMSRIIVQEESKVPLSHKNEVSEMLHMLAFKPNLMGYNYMVRLLEKCNADPKYHLKSMTRVIYPSLAKEFETTASAVERALRHSIQRSFERVPERYNEFFNSELKNPPTNSEFISMISEHLSHSMA